MDDNGLALYDMPRAQLAAFISELIEKDFSRLVQLLYRFDVSETRLKDVLASHPASDAAGLIADLLVERIEKTRESRRQFRMNGEIPEDEKW